LQRTKRLRFAGPLAKLWADFDAKTHFTTLTPGQFHFVEGIYVGSPTTPDGLPPGDGALLATHDGAQNGIIFWTRGPLACRPLPISEKLAVDGEYGAETRQVVTSFQMRTGIAADGVAAAQTEAKLLSELNRMRESDGHLPR
jgi:peptidoglycan hydrolase-like protein with peptidoglycan-binding domain